MMGILQTRTHSIYFSSCSCSSSSSSSATYNSNNNQRKQHLHVKFPNQSVAIMSLRKRRKCTRNSCAAASHSSLSSPPPPPPPPDKKDEQVQQRKVPDLQTLLRRFWKVAAPYWWSSDDKVQARLRLAAVFTLTLGTTGISVGFSFLGRDFYNALANKDQEQFTKQLLYYVGGFAGGIPFFVLRDYARETLALRWRSWMTSYYMDRYLTNQTFYRIQSQSIVDNPDQRIVDDLGSFTGTSLSFSLILFNAAVDLISFSNILYGIYPPLFVVLLVYSIGGTAISVFLGRGLVTLNFFQEKKEADFRYGLVRVRENAESIAFYGGEENEMQLLLQRFRSAFENLTQLLISSRNLEFFTNGYRYLIQILPAAVVAPMYFSGKIEFGVINQSVSAFNHILGDFSLIVYQFQAISAFSAVIDRLGEFDDVLDSSSSKCLSDSLEEIRLVYCSVSSPTLESNGSMPADKCQKLLDIENLTLQTPISRATLVRDLSLEINDKDHLLVTGPSGSGKTSLLRAMAGLWSTGRGKITFYVKDAEDPQPPISSDMAPLEANTTVDTYGELKRPKNRNSRGIFFLPQRPYMVLGTLRQQLLYPTWVEDAIPTSDSTRPAGIHWIFVLEAPAALVSFKSRFGAAIALHIQQGVNPTEWITEGAPEPQDVHWPFFSALFISRWIFKLVVVVAFIALTIFFLIPVVIVQGLTNLDQLETWFPFLESILSLTVVSEVITGYLPSLILQLFLSLVPPIMIRLSSLEGYISLSQIDNSACIKVLWFTIWNIFFANTLSGSAFYQVNIFLEPKKIPEILAEAVPAQASFFIAYVVTSGWTSLSSELFRTFPLISNYIKRLFKRIAGDEFEVPSISYYSKIPRVLFFGLLGITYFFLAPLILPFILVYYSLGYIIYRNQLLNVYAPKYETGGRIWPIVHNSTIVSLILMHIIAIGIFGLKKLPLASSLVVPLPVLTLLFNGYCRKRFLPIFKAYPAECLIKKDREGQNDPTMAEFYDRLVTAYQDPALMPIQYSRRIDGDNSPLLHDAEV